MTDLPSLHARRAEIALRQLFAPKPPMPAVNDNDLETKRYFVNCFDMAIGDMLRAMGARELAAINRHLAPMKLSPAAEQWQHGFWWALEDRLMGAAQEGSGSLDHLQAHLKQLYYEMDASKRGRWLSPGSQRFLYDLRDLATAVNHWGPEMKWSVMTEGWSRFIDSYLDAASHNSSVDRAAHKRGRQKVREHVQELSRFLQQAQDQHLLAPRTALGGPYQSASWTGRIDKEQANSVERER